MKKQPKARKLLSLLTALCLLLTLVVAGMSAFAADGPELQVSAVAGRDETEGSILTVTVKLPGSANAYGGGFSLKFNTEHLEFLKKVAANGTFNDHAAPDAVKLSFANSEAYPDTELLSIILKIKDGQSASAEDISLDGAYLTDINGIKIPGVTHKVTLTCSHDWGEWSVTTPATCTAGGTETRTCKLCGGTDTRETGPLGHDWGEWTVTTPATCTEQGEETRACSRCDATETRPIPVLGHDWGEVEYEWADDGSACTAKHVCTREGCKASETAEATITSAITKPATCKAEGETTYTAVFAESWAGTDTKVIENVPVDPEAHAWGDWTVTKEPTATEKGEETRICSLCGAAETRELPVTPGGTTPGGTTPGGTTPGGTTPGGTDIPKTGGVIIGGSAAALAVLAAAASAVCLLRKKNYGAQ